jgi:hypothetical protein
MNNTEQVYVVTLGYTDYVFYQQKDAIEAWNTFSKAYKLEHSWRTSKNYVDIFASPSLKVVTVYDRAEVLKEEEEKKEQEHIEKEKEESV